MRIFLSYSAEDRPAAERIQLALRANGHDAFMDRSHLPVAQEYDKAIAEAIGRCHLLVFLIGPAAFEPGRYTLTELGLAEKRWPHPGGHVLPVMVREMAVSTLPAYLRAVNILHPRGDVAAETAHEVERLMRSKGPLAWLSRENRSPTRIAAAIALATAVVALSLYAWQQREAAGFAYAPDSIRHRTRAVVATDSGLLAVTAAPPGVEPFSARGLERSSWGSLRGDPVLALRSGNALIVATRAPDAVVVFDARSGRRIDSVAFDPARVVRPREIAAAARLSGDITSVAVVDGKRWIVTGERDGDPNVYHLRQPERQWALATWAAMPTGFGFDARGLVLRRVGEYLWGVSAQTTPASLYRIVGFMRVDEFKGHDIQMVSCAHDLAESADGNLLLLSCDNELLEVRTDGNTLVLVKAWPTLPSESAVGNWTSEIIVPIGRSVVVALNTESNQPANRPAHLRIAEVSETGVVKKLLDMNDTIATSMAVTATTVAVVLRLADGSTDVITVQRPLRMTGDSTGRK